MVSAVGSGDNVGIGSSSSGKRVVVKEMIVIIAIVCKKLNPGYIEATMKGSILFPT